MADKRGIKRSLKQLQTVKTWQLVILLILLGFVAATLLRMNNTGMIARRDAVLAADKSGDTEAIRARLYELQHYSASHMNAASGVFYLQEQYNRDVKKAVDASSASSTVNAEANAQAEAVCHPQYRGWSTAYMTCFLNELAKFPTASTLPTPTLPSAGLYRYSFISPAWSPDFAGFAVLGCLLIVLAIVIRLISLLILRLLLHRHYRET